MAAAILPLLLIITVWPGSAADDAAKAALLAVKSSLRVIDPASLSSWSPTTSPCADRHAPWAGVVCDRANAVVTGLRLESLSLSGSIDAVALSRIPSIRTISFNNNTLSGPIPAFDAVAGLRALFLSRNAFDGPIPDGFFAGMRRLKKLHLSHNRFSGRIPPSLSNATMLLELHLAGNCFSGEIPQLKLPSLRLLNLSDNNLTGRIPDSLASKFKENSFINNSGLCGPPLTGRPCSKPHKGGGWMRTAQVVVGLVIVAVLAAAAVVVARQRREGPGTPKGTGKGKAKGGELVVVREEGEGLGMGELMGAAAEVMGSGGVGAAYKAVMGDGRAVAVKMVREMGGVKEEKFDAEMRRMGRLKHHNVLAPLAYHYGKDEKLILLEYVPKGSLLYILHGDRGSDHAALDWPTRLKIIGGIAEGLSYLHAELGSMINVPHGNLKSGNVLLATDFSPLLVDYAFSPLLRPSVSSRALFAYKSPESLSNVSRVSPKSDVYCLGIIILEVITGKFPAQYLTNASGGTDVVDWAKAAIEEDRVAELIDPAIIVNAKPSVPEMERLIRVGVACVEPDPEKRIDVEEARRRIEEIAADVGKKPAASAMAGGGESQERAVRAGSVAGGSIGSGDDVSFAIS